MITFLSCLLLIAYLLFIYVVRTAKKNEERDRIALRLAAVLAGNKQDRYPEAEAAELHATRWDGD